MILNLFKLKKALEIIGKIEVVKSSGAVNLRRDKPLDILKEKTIEWKNRPLDIQKLKDKKKGFPGRWF